MNHRNNTLTVHKACSGNKDRSSKFAQRNCTSVFFSSSSIISLSIAYLFFAYVVSKARTCIIVNEEKKKNRQKATVVLPIAAVLTILRSTFSLEFSKGDTPQASDRNYVRKICCIHRVSNTAAVVNSGSTDRKVILLMHVMRPSALPLQAPEQVLQHWK